MAPPITGYPPLPTPPVVRIVGPVPVIIDAIPLPTGAATEMRLAVVASTLAENVAATTAGLATVAAEAAANSALLLAATDTVASTAAANSALLLAATNTVASVAAATASVSDAIASAILTATVSPPPITGSVGVTNFPAIQPVSGSVAVNNFPATQPVSVSNFPAVQSVSSTPVQNAGKVINRFVLAQAGVAGTATIAAASPGNKHKIIGVVLSLSAVGTVKFRDTTDLTGAINMLGSAPLVIPPDPSFSLVETLANRALSIVTTGGGGNGVILYLTEP